MEEQMSLDLTEPRVPASWDDDPKGDNLRELFKLYHETNPHVYQLLRDLAFEEFNSGIRSGSINQLYEVARRNLKIEAHERGETKPKVNLNNTYRAGYARMLMHNEKKLKGFFEVRSSTVEAQYKRGRKPWKD